MTTTTRIILIAFMSAFLGVCIGYYLGQPTDAPEVKRLKIEAATQARKGHDMSAINAREAAKIEPAAKAREESIAERFKTDSTILVSLPRRDRDSVVLGWLNLGLPREAR